MIQLKKLVEANKGEGKEPEAITSEKDETKQTLNEQPTLADRAKEVMDKTGDDVDKSLDAEESEDYLLDVLDNVDVEEYQGDIEVALNETLAANIGQRFIKKPSYLNLLLVGDAGCGKTARVEAWAEKHKIHLVKMLTSTMDQGDFSIMAPNMDTLNAQKLTTDEFDILNEPNTVLFLDEYNRADFAIRGALLTLINNHEVPASGKDEKGHLRDKKHFDNFLFTVAAINPSDSGNYNVQKIDSAELGRLGTVNVKNDPEATRRFLNDHFDEIINSKAPNSLKNLCRWKKVLVNILLDEDSKFEFDDATEIKTANKKNVAALNPRSLTFALDAVVRPTLADFESKFKRFSNPDKWDYVLEILTRKRFDDLTKINLDDYEEVDDKATQALDGGTQSEVIRNAQAKDVEAEEPEDIGNQDEDEVQNQPAQQPQQQAQQNRRPGGLLGRIQQGDRKANH